MSPSCPAGIELLFCLMSFRTYSVVIWIGCDVLRDALHALRDYCSELFAEGNDYFVFIGDLSIFEGYWLVGWYVWFFSGRLGNESEETSGVLRSLTGLNPSPPVLSIVVSYNFGNLLV